MSRKHFIAIADDLGLTLRRIDQCDGRHDDHIRKDLIPMLIVTFTQANPNFDAVRFVKRINRTRKEGLLT